MKTSSTLGLAVGLALVSAGSWAAPVCSGQSFTEICKDDGVTVSVPKVNGFLTTGADMVGMTVTAVFSGEGDGNLVTVSAEWLKTGDKAGGAGESGRVGGDWNLSVDGDTFDTPWLFDFDGDLLGQLVSFTLSGRAADVIFDTSAPAEGTPGSENGRDFSLIVGGGCPGINPSCDWRATYVQAVKLGDQAAQGDAFMEMSVSFLGGTGPESSFQFMQDTDLVDRDTNPIPEPGTLLLAGLALAGLGASRGRIR